MFDDIFDLEGFAEVVLTYTAVYRLAFCACDVVLGLHYFVQSFANCAFFGERVCLRGCLDDYM